MDWMNIAIGLAGVLVPAILAKLGIKVPFIIPTPTPTPSPNIPMADEELVLFDRWLDRAASKQITVDTFDLQLLMAMRPKIDVIVPPLPKQS